MQTFSSQSEPSDNARLWLKRVARGSAWALLVSVVIAVFSGWGITQTGIIYKITFGLVDRRLADEIHRAINLPLALFFLLHVLINMRLAITVGHPFRARLTNVVLIVIGVCVLGIVVYLEYFRLGG